MDACIFLRIRVKMPIIVLKHESKLNGGEMKAGRRGAYKRFIGEWRVVSGSIC